MRLDGQLLLARIAFLLEETEQAHEMATRALDEARASELVWLQARAHGLLGLILHVQDGFTTAAPSFERALDIFESTGMRLEHARVLYAQATILLDHKVSARRRQAVADVSQVRLVFQECQAGLDLHSAEQLLKVRVIPTIRTLPRRGKRTPKPTGAGG